MVIADMQEEAEFVADSTDGGKSEYFGVLETMEAELSERNSFGLASVLKIKSRTGRVNQTRSLSRNLQVTKPAVLIPLHTGRN
jgi:hypothetical protein